MRVDSCVRRKRSAGRWVQRVFRPSVESEERYAVVWFGVRRSGRVV